VLTDGLLMGWGSNDNGRVGDGTTELRPLPVPVLNLAVEAFQVWSWALEAQVDKLDHYVGEPLVLRLAFRNLTDEPIYGKDR